MTDLWRLDAAQLAGAYRSGATSPTEVVDALGRRIERLDRVLGAFSVLTLDRAEAEARELTAELARGVDRGPLHGIPVGIKELFDVAGIASSYGAPLLQDRIGPADAEVVRRLRAAGCIAMGTTRSHEFGWGITTQNRTLGSTYNPWDPARVPGGSSGGSAAALATGMVPLALGSDTGGSIRIPAALCGVMGFKPTYGRIPKRGGVALAPSLDHPGPMARSVADLHAGFDAMAGPDADDPSTLHGPPLAPARRDATPLRFATVPDLHLRALEPDHEKLFTEFVDRVAGTGAAVDTVSFPGAADIRPAFGTVQMAEAYHVHNAVLGTFPSRRAEYGTDVRRRLEMAGEVAIGDYLEARATADRIRATFAAVFTEVDVIFTPVAAGRASTTADPDRALLRDAEIPFRDLVMDYTVPQDLAGLPTCVLPIGLDELGLPVGIQLTGAYGADLTVLSTAGAIVASLSLEHRWPPIAEEAT